MIRRSPPAGQVEKTCAVQQNCSRHVGGCFCVNTAECVALAVFFCCQAQGILAMVLLFNIMPAEPAPMDQEGPDDQKEPSSGPLVETPQEDPGEGQPG
jgi:hypothetical protein